MGDEPTLGEVVRRLEAIHQDLKEDLREYGARLDTKVSMERYGLEQVAALERERLLIERVRAMEEQREKEQHRRAADRRLLFTALVAPVLLIILQVYLNARGAAA